MKRFLYNLFWLGLWASLPLGIWAQQHMKDQAFMRDYEGTINGNLPIQLHLVNWGSGALSGNYLYKKVGKEIELYGEFTTANTFNIKEYAQDKHTGTFDGTFASPDKITGTWSDPKGTKKLPFTVTAVKRAADNSGWTGTWHLNDVWDSGTLLIGNVRADSADFAISVFRAGHLGEVEGTAWRKGNQLVFSRHLPVVDDPSSKCTIQFTLKGDYVQIEQTSSGWDCGFGMRAYASGKFEKTKRVLKPSIKYGAEGVFANKAQHDGFLALVGSKMYEKFAFNLQGFDKQAQEPGDGFKATVILGAAAGMYMTNEAIILYDERGKFWAATLDFVGEQGLIRYFTNDDKFKKKLPLTIDKWRERFVDYEVKFP